MRSEVCGDVNCAWQTVHGPVVHIVGYCVSSFMLCLVYHFDSAVMSESATGWV